MEESLKRDVIRELRAGQGRILLHDEVEERPNVFSIVPLWEAVSEEDIMTPGDVFKLMAKEGYQVSISQVW
jgi:Inositol hexakisphosphate